MRLVLAFVVGAVTAFATPSYAQEAKKAPTPARPATPTAEVKKDHIMLNVAELVWTDGPPVMPPGQKVALLEGELTKPGPYTARAKVPAGYKIPPHWHPAVEHVTVLEGTMAMGIGEKWDEKAMHEMGPGGFMAM